MNLENLLLNISSNNFKNLCKKAKKEIKKSPLVFALEYRTLRQKKIKKQELEKQITLNTQIISDLQREHYTYTNQLNNLKQQTYIRQKRQNLSRRIKRANINHEDLIICLYRVNLDLISARNDVSGLLTDELNHIRQQKIDSFIEEFEKEM